MPKRNVAWILVIVVMVLMMWQVPQIIAGRDSVYRAFGPLVDARAEIHRRFVDEVDDARIVSAAVDAGIGAMISALHDPFASFLTDEEYDRFCKRAEGVVGSIGVDLWATDQGLEVLSREPNSPAAEAGIHPGDILTHVDGQPTQGVALIELLVNLLHGPPDSAVQVTVITPGSPDGPPPTPRELTLRRAIMPIDPVRGWRRLGSRGWRYFLDEEDHIAYVRITKFTQNVVDRLDAQIHRLVSENLRGLVLDLRENTGGLLDGARDVADRFLDDGLIVSTRGRKTEGRQWFATRNGTYPPFRVAVLVNGMTASAAEIVAGALRDHRRAVVVGERTHGKGCVQEVVRLEAGIGAIKLTTAYYYLPNGECIHRTRQAVLKDRWGVTPNVPVNMTRRQRQACLAVWRDLSREPVLDAETRPADRASDAPAVEVEMRERLLDADVPLRKAVEELRRQLAPRARPRPATRPAPTTNR